MKKNVKKVMALLLALVLCTAMLAGCGGDKGEAPKTVDEVKGETYDTGNISALVPNGWKAFPVSDLFDSYDGEYDPTALQICKGGENDFDLFTKPYVQINYYPDNTMYVSSDWYDDVVDLDPMQIGGYTWNGFTCNNMDYPTAVLYTDGDVQIQITMILENDGGKIALEDVDVQAIIASIQVK